MVETHTSFSLEANDDIIMFARIFRDIDAYEVLGWIVTSLGQRELGIDDANEIDSRARKRLEGVGALEGKIHAGSLREVLEEAD